MLLISRPSLPLSPAGLFALYVVLYTGFRFYLETLRIDPSHEIAGLRVNAWVSGILFVLSLAFFIWWQLLRRRSSPGRREPKAAATADDGRPTRPRPTTPLASLAVMVVVRELELDPRLLRGLPSICCSRCS